MSKVVNVLLLRSEAQDYNSFVMGDDTSSVLKGGAREQVKVKVVNVLSEKDEITAQNSKLSKRPHHNSFGPPELINGEQRETCARLCLSKRKEKTQE